MAIIRNEPHACKPFNWAKRDFSKTNTAMAQKVIRDVLCHAGDLTPGERRVARRLGNLAIHHSKHWTFEATIAAIAKYTRDSVRTVKRGVSKLLRMGILIRLKGGNGRGDKSQYAFDFTRMFEVLAPNLNMHCAGETVDMDGCVKGGQNDGAYKKNSFHAPTGGVESRERKPVRGVDVPLHVNFPRWMDMDDLAKVIRRLGAAKNAWFRRLIPAPFWSAKSNRAASTAVESEALLVWSGPAWEAPLTWPAKLRSDWRAFMLGSIL